MVGIFGLASSAMLTAGLGLSGPWVSGGILAVGALSAAAGAWGGWAMRAQRPGQV